MSEVEAGPDRTLRSGTIRGARAHEAMTLSELALRSKAHWGYDPNFIEACRPELSVTADLIAQGDVFLFEGRGRTLGFYSLAPWNSDIELNHLFVDPPHIGHGIGRILWKDAVKRIAGRGYERFLIQSDPNAEGFYLRMGAERIGQVPSGVRPGRSLPLLLFALRDDDGSS